MKSGVYSRSEEAMLKSSRIWGKIKCYSLQDNVRLGIGINTDQSEENKQFAPPLLQISEGQICSVKRIFLNHIPVEFQEQAKLCYNRARAHVHQASGQMIIQRYKVYAKYPEERIILTTLNQDAAKVNWVMLKNLKCSSITAVLVDRPEYEANTVVTVEALDKIDFLGFPDHQIQLKVSALVVLLRNLGIKQGLCNGAISGHSLTVPFQGKNSSYQRSHCFMKVAQHLRFHSSLQIPISGGFGFFYDYKQMPRTEFGSGRLSLGE
jgi:hypothetical protein